MSPRTMHMPQVTRLEECGRAEDVDIKMSAFIHLIRMATTGAPSASGARVGEAVARICLMELPHSPWGLQFSVS